jgi:hypothetical protein
VWSTNYFCWILTKLEFSRKISKKKKKRDLSGLCWLKFEFLVLVFRRLNSTGFIFKTHRWFNLTSHFRTPSLKILPPCERKSWNSVTIYGASCNCSAFPAKLRISGSFDFVHSLQERRVNTCGSHVKEIASCMGAGVETFFFVWTMMSRL